MKIALIDYGSGNLRSAAKSMERAAGELGLSAQVMVTSDADQVARADRIILPGVGAFADCAAGLQALDGMWQALEEAVLRQGKPFLGICVGMQLLADCSLEHGETPGFGWIPGEVIPIAPGKGLKIPHMGWNTLELTQDHPVLNGLGEDPHAYFVHSFQFVPKDPAHRLAITHYGSEISAVIGRDNIIGTQFHPEKSQRTGLALLRNFLEWCP